MTTSFKTIKKIYKIEKKNKKLRDAKNGMHIKIENLQRRIKKLQHMGEDMIEIIAEQNTEMEGQLDTNIENAKLIQHLNSKVSEMNKIKRTNQCTSTSETKIMIAIVLCWTMVWYLFYNNIVDEGSFMLMNLCGFMACVVVSVF